MKAGRVLKKTKDCTAGWERQLGGGVGEFVNKLDSAPLFGG